jgi:hypothetical protein
MKNHLFAALLFCGTAQASSNLWNHVSTSVTASYDSRYILHGYDLGPSLLHGSLDLYSPLSEVLSVWAGAWYGTQSDGTYNEVDLYAGIDAQLNTHLAVGVAYSMFNYLEVSFPTSAEAHEFSGHITLSAGELSLSLRDLYDSEAEGHLARAVLQWNRQVTGALSLVLSTETGYSFGYFTEEDGLHHALFKLAAPWQLTDRLSVKPFIAQSLALDAIDAYEEDHTFGGISITASF